VYSCIFEALVEDKAVQLGLLFSAEVTLNFTRSLMISRMGGWQLTKDTLLKKRLKILIFVLAINFSIIILFRALVI